MPCSALPALPVFVPPRLGSVDPGSGVVASWRLPRRWSESLPLRQRQLRRLGARLTVWIAQQQAGAPACGDGQRQGGEPAARLGLPEGLQLWVLQHLQRCDALADAQAAATARPALAAASTGLPRLSITAP